MTRRETQTKPGSKLDRSELLALAQNDIDKGNLQAGLSTLKGLLEDSPVLPEVQMLAGRVYAQLRMFDRARPLFEAYLTHEPGAVTERFQLGMTWFDEGNNSRALQVWRDLLTGDTPYIPALFYSALALSLRQEDDASLSLLDKILERVPAENLYHGRAMELKQAIESRRGSNGEGTASEGADRG